MDNSQKEPKKIYTSSDSINTDLHNPSQKKCLLLTDSIIPEKKYYFASLSKKVAIVGIFLFLTSFMFMGLNKYLSIVFLVLTPSMLLMATVLGVLSFGQLRGYPKKQGDYVIAVIIIPFLLLCYFLYGCLHLLSKIF